MNRGVFNSFELQSTVLSIVFLGCKKHQYLGHDLLSWRDSDLDQLRTIEQEEVYTYTNTNMASDMGELL